MASYSVNERGVAKARRMIDAHQYVIRSNWGEAQPSAEDENRFRDSHSWDDYAEWHLGLTDGANDETKARYAFVYGDFRRLHRSGLIACVYRAAEWEHKEIGAGGARAAAVPRRRAGLRATAAPAPAWLRAPGGGRTA
ncbi:MAG: hypothetical protein ACRD12_00520 [Acidimicrobiales bacterium]